MNFSEFRGAIGPRTLPKSIRDDIYDGSTWMHACVHARPHVLFGEEKGDEVVFRYVKYRQKERQAYGIYACKQMAMQMLASCLPFLYQFSSIQIIIILILCYYAIRVSPLLYHPAVLCSLSSGVCVDPSAMTSKSKRTSWRSIIRSKSNYLPFRS